MRGQTLMLLPLGREKEMEDRHEYRVNAFGAGGRNGVVHAEGVLSCISFSAPPEFLGEPGHWTPEHFLVAPVANCFVSTFSGIAEKSRLGFASFNLDTEGLLGNGDGIWRFTEIKLWPVVTIRKEEDRDRAIHLLEKAGKSCLIARSLQFKVTLFPAVKIAEELSVSASPLRDLRRQNDQRSLTTPAARLQ